MNNIFCFREHEGENAHGSAVAADGEVLLSVESANLEQFRYRVGLSNANRHGLFAAKYPDGFNLVELIGLDRLRAAQRRGAPVRARFTERSVLEV